MGIGPVVANPATTAVVLSKESVSVGGGRRRGFVRQKRPILADKLNCPPEVEDWAHKR